LRIPTDCAHQLVRVGNKVGLYLRKKISDEKTTDLLREQKKYKDQLMLMEKKKSLQTRPKSEKKERTLKANKT